MTLSVPYMRPFCGLLVLLGGISRVGSIIVEQVSDLPSLKFDFIIIGGGTAGNVIASRLSEDPDCTVLVLEAGPTNANVTDSMIPFFCTHLTPNTPFDWNFTTTPQLGLNNRSVSFPRGHMLGGSSSVNFMAYTRGTKNDFDRFANISGDKGWSWDALQPFFRLNERFSPPADNHNTSAQFDPQFHSFNGTNLVSLAGFPTPIDDRVIQTTKEMSAEFPFVLDYNSGSNIGIGWTQSTIGGGTRSSSATSYLRSEVINRKNLHVLLHAQVARVIKTGTKEGKPLFRDVDFAEGVGGPRRLVTATKEIIISAGAIGTPHILLNSGIGDETVLKSIGITPLANVPDVGRNLTDHPFSTSLWSVRSNNTFDTARENPSIANLDMQEWQTERMGPLVNGVFNQVGWVRLAKEVLERIGGEDPAAGSGTAHFELIFSNGRVSPPFPATGNFLAIGTAVLTPTSRGSVTINSTDPFAPPLIDPNFLSTPFDIMAMREAIRSARRFLSAPVWSDLVITPANGPLDSIPSDDDLDAFIRNSTGSVFHPVGTSAMSPEEATTGVVNPNLKLKKVEGIRVIDASVFPRIPAGHTQAPTYVFAERGAQMIKDEWELKAAGGDND